MLNGVPYPIKGLVDCGVNLFQSLPNVPKTKKALKNLDFYVAIDTLPQEHVMWADVILPECTYLERYDPPLKMASAKAPYILLRQPVVEPMYDSKPGWWIARELGIRLGLKKFFPWENYEDALNQEFKSIGSSLKKVKKTGIVLQKWSRPTVEDWAAKEKSPFTTPSKKIELYSQELADAGLDPIPKYEPVAEMPEGYLRLLYGRTPMHSFTRTTNNPWLSEIKAENEVWLNPEVAKSLGVSNGERVILENQDGYKSNPIRARVTLGIRPDCVYMAHGFGLKAPGLKRANERGASDAYLQTRYARDPISGGAGLRVNGVKVMKLS